jgi:sugar lactone lactonase YvrE
VVDGSGNVFFTDTTGNRVRRIDALTGAITTVAGTGAFGYVGGTTLGDGGAAAKAILTQPSGLALDAAGNLYIADSFVHAVRKVDTNGVITLFAGNEANGGFVGDGLPAATQGRLKNPQLLATDNKGNLYIADKENNRVQKVDGAGILRNIAGSGGNSTTTAGGFSGDFIPGVTSLTTTTTTTVTSTSPYNGQPTTTTTVTSTSAPNFGYAVEARLGQPQGVAVDHFGNVYIADTANNRIRMIAVTDSSGAPLLSSTGQALTDSTRTITTVAGGGTLFGAASGAINPLNAVLSGPRGLAVDSSNNVYIADTGNNRILYLTACLPAPGGATSSCTPNLTQVFPLTSPALSNPQAIALDAAGNLYVAEGTANRIRKINAADGSSVILDALQVGTINLARGLAVDSAGNLTVADTLNQRIVKFAAVALTAPGTGSSAAAVTQIAGITCPTGASSCSALTGANPSLAAKPPVWGPDVPAPAQFSKLVGPWGGAFDASGNYYFAEKGTHRVRKIDSNGNLSTVAGTGYQVTVTSQTATNKTQSSVTTLNNGYYGDGGLAVAAQLNGPSAVAVDSTNSYLYIADSSNHVIRRVNLNTGIITTYAGIAPGCATTNPTSTAINSSGIAGTTTNPACVGTSGASGDGLLGTDAQLNTPEGVAVDSAGNLYIADSGNHAIREVNFASGVITTIAGFIGSEGRGGDNILATTGALDEPVSVAVDAAGNVFWVEGCVTQTNNNTGSCQTDRVRRLDAASGMVTTLSAGSTTATLAAGTLGGDGGSSTKAAVTYPMAVAVDANGNVFVTDSTNRIREFSPVPTH